ncbi:hypothetical protein HMPREF9080_02155 [Cardiobacterium valvarum F0432]|uniref:Uncharacterized protein n=1 Tax=Cardiobacterium valvarum F0432 TaxID=797473 RepID=G9ZH98_9GAMM|nr:hypothetical protein HMPREF9080_02155 [Cardiobacterium valvarum F0432]
MAALPSARSDAQPERNHITADRRPSGSSQTASRHHPAVESQASKRNKCQGFFILETLQQRLCISRSAIARANGA